MDSANRSNPTEPAADERPEAPAAGHAQTQLAAGTGIGRVIDDRYRVVAMLGEGGMGAVYVAEHLKLHKQVALKVIRPELAGIGDVAARFAREAMATARFEHPHVASAIDYGTFPEGGAYLVMQLVQGESLRRILEAEGRLHWRRMCGLGAQIADALAAAKAEGIVHRDLKPDNIMIERRDDGSELVKILDFGIARISAKGEAAPEGAALTRELTRVGTVVGTPGYMAPEQAIGDSVDHRVDLYALGVVLWEGLTGEALWDAPDLTTMVTRQLSEPVPSVREKLRRGDIPAEVDGLIVNLLARRAEDRPDQPGHVRDALRRLAFASDAGTGALVGLGSAAAHASQILRTARSSWHQARQQWRRLGDLQRLGIAVALVLLVAGVSGGWAATSSEPSASDAPAEAAAPVEPGAAAEGEPPQASLSKKVSEALQRLVVKKPEPPKPPEPRVPEALRPEVEALFEAARLARRRQAAEKVLAHEPPPELPRHVTLVAHFEAARGCRPRNEAIAEMVEARDPGVLPALERIHEAPRRGCGFLGLGDCHTCLRRAVAHAVSVLKPLDEQVGSASSGDTATAPAK